MIFLEKTQIPLLKDNHTHPSIWAALNDCVDLRTIKNKEEALSIIKKKDEDISIILGWNSGNYSFDKNDLNKLPPVIICNASFHNFLINDTAKEMLSKTHRNIIKNIENKSWVEKNIPIVVKSIVSIKSCKIQQIKSFYDKILTEGVWFAEDMLIPSEEILKTFKNSEFWDRTRFWTDIKTFNELNNDAQKSIHGLKFFTDGAIGAKTAALKKPYLNGERGVLSHSDDKLMNLIEYAIEIDKPIAIHAIGDLATEQVIKVLKLLKMEGFNFPETRIEHCQFISKSNAIKAKKLGIKLCMQPKKLGFWTNKAAVFSVILFPMSFSSISINLNP